MATTKQLQQTLNITYGLVPIAAGADKFTNILTNRANYLGPNIKGMLPIEPTSFMKVAGVIKIVA